MSNVIDFQSKRQEFLKRAAEKSHELTQQWATRLEQLKQFGGASFSDQVRFSLESENSWRKPRKLERLRRQILQANRP